MRLTQIMGAHLQGKRNTKKLKNPERVTVREPTSSKQKESNSVLSEFECEQRRDNKRVKRSAELSQVNNNVKSDHAKINLIERNSLKWFTVSNANCRGRKYKVELAESIKCTCEFFNKKTLHASTQFKHILDVLNIPQSPYILQQMYLT